MFPSLLLFQSMGAIAGSIPIERATPTDAGVRYLIRFLVNMISTSTTCETLMIKQPNVKIINTLLKTL